MSININIDSKQALAISMTERQNQQAAEMGLLEAASYAPGTLSPSLQKIMWVVAKLKNQKLDTCRGSI
jgi:hypothetical protein